MAELIGGVQLDLFGAVERSEQVRAEAAAKAELVIAWRATMHLDCCTDEPCPVGVRPKIVDGTLIEPPPGDPDRYEFEQVRCGRCAELTFVYGMTINHDLGWTGCPRDRERGRRMFRDEQEMSANRHDNLHHGACAACGCAWGLHSSGSWALRPHEEASCYGWCRCRGYVAPAAEADWICASCRYPVIERNDAWAHLFDPKYDDRYAGDDRCTAAAPILRRDAS